MLQGQQAAAAARSAPLIELQAAEDSRRSRGRMKELYSCAGAGKPHPDWVKVSIWGT